MKRLIGALATVAAIAVPGAASAQQVSDAVKRECEQAANQVARYYMDLKQRGHADLEKGIYRASTNWGEQVAIYMAQVATRSDSITMRELATLGTAYCIERRPSDVN